MNEPLTDEQLDDLSELWIGGLAAAEIRRLRAEVEAQVLAGIMGGDVVELIKSENSRLREKMSWMVELVETRWSFNQDQQHTHSWHDKQDTLTEIRDALKKEKNNE